MVILSRPPSCSLLRFSLIILLWLFFGAWTDIGINFRNTDTYVTDGANQTWCQASGNVGVTTDTFSVSRGGALFGYTSTAASGSDIGRDRDNTVNVRLAGTHKHLNNGSQDIWKLTLTTPGQKSIRFAAGDTGNACEYTYLEILDNVTSKLVIDHSGGTAQDEYYDASNTLRTEAAWLSSNAPALITFASTSLIIKLGTPTPQSGYSCLAHLQVTDVASGSTLRALIQAGGL